MKQLVILGAGGHGRVVADAARHCKLWTEVVFLDDGVAAGTKVLGATVVGKISEISSFRSADFALGIGNNEKRLEFARMILKDDYSLPTIAHPSSICSDSAQFEPGCVILASTVVAPGTTLGIACIVNSGATVDHDCILGDGVHVGPGVHIGGDTRIEDVVWIGIGAAVRNGLSIGKGAIVGAGAAVVADVQDAQVVVGVPAKQMV